MARSQSPLFFGRCHLCDDGDGIETIATRIREIQEQSQQENWIFCHAAIVDYAVNISYARPETDQERLKREQRQQRERERRQARAAARSLAQEKRDLELYQKLKKRFEHE